jgi:hypothetical protein
MENFVIGINYEAGKIVNHVLRYKECIAFANCQIVMDAPYHGRVADENIRSQGRSETLYSEYNENDLVNGLEKIFMYIKREYENIHIIIQIARGRSAESMTKTIVIPILDKLSIKKYNLIYGYKTFDYFKYDTVLKPNTPFIFVNIGMFAVLNNVDDVSVGQICNPIICYEVNEYKDNKFDSNSDNIYYNNNKNILNKHASIKQIVLVGINDNMKFITPDVYSYESIINLITSLKL